MTEGRLTLVIVDDHPLFSEALAERLSSEPDLEVPAVVQRADEAITVIARTRPSVVLLDHMLGPRSGLTVLRAVRQNDSQAKIIMLSARSDVDQVVNAIRLGARAWVPKSGDVDQLIHVIHSVASGRSWLPEELIGPVLDRLIHEPDQQADLLASLTGREREVLAAMIDGLTRSDIARALSLSPNTVRTHAQNLLAKLNCHSVLEAVALARRHGMQPSERART
jgi:DNA-binding NarL/FixJ family response regulator